MLIGEPGAGKTKLINHFFESNQEVQIVKGITLDSFSTIDTSKKTIIDGIDEIVAYESTPTISRILSKLSSPNFILTCRSADWRHNVNLQIIKERWNVDPIVGSLVPLDEDEIIEFVENQGGDGRQFIREAKVRDFDDVLKNPLYLNLFLRVVQNSGWPQTRLKLFEEASLSLVKERQDSAHHELNRTRTSNEKLLETAGYIFSHILLGGFKGITLNSESNENFLTKNELVSDRYTLKVIDELLSSNLFLYSGNDVEPYHRIISEFLASKWIAQEIQKNQNPLIFERIETVLYGNRFEVPSAYRGIHGWLATFSPLGLSKKIIERDPYGFLRYGDPASVSIEQAKALIISLQKLANDDPYFRSEDWNVSFKNKLIKPDLFPTIIEIINTPETPEHLAHLLIESMHGANLTDEVFNFLVETIKNTIVAYFIRQEAVAVLLNNEKEPDWDSLIDYFVITKDADSIRLGLEICTDRASLFEGKEIANLMIKYEESQNEEDVTIVGVGYGIEDQMSISQLDDCLQMLTHHLSQKKPVKKSASWLFKLAKKRLQISPLPDVKIIFEWLNLTKGHNYFRHDWDEFLTTFLKESPDLRQSLQSYILNQSNDEREYSEYLTNFIPQLDFGMIGFYEEDFVRQLQEVEKNRDNCRDWDIRWRYLVLKIRRHTYFVGDAMDFAEKQAKKYLILQKHLKEITTPSIPEYELTHQQVLNEQIQKREAQKRERHESFTRIKSELEKGESLFELYKVAGAYLGIFLDIYGDAPIDRVIELVGREQINSAFIGLENSIRSLKIPSVREIATNHAQGKKYYVEYILIAFFHFFSNNDEVLNLVSSDITCSALASCQWDLGIGKNNISRIVQETLEKIVFSEPSQKLDFVRNTIEPYLERNHSHISGLYYMERIDGTPKIGELALDWLNKYPISAEDSLEKLIITAISNGQKDKLLKIIRKKIKNKTWTHENEKNIWMGIAFLLDFDLNQEIIATFAKEKKEHLWVLKRFVSRQKQNWLSLTEKQMYFLIYEYGPLWPYCKHPSTFSGSQNPWDAFEFISGLITRLGSKLSDEATSYLQGLSQIKSLDQYSNHIKHTLSQHIRKKAESNKRLLSLEQLRDVLRSGQPTGHSDLQALILSALERLQEKIKNSTEDDYITYWDKDTPQTENYCRDRLSSQIQPFLEKFGIATTKEAAMANNKRCDLKVIFGGAMNVPIEIKGQWHKDLWIAAVNQLKNYTDDYKSDGFGIYLVLWFGDVPNTLKQPRCLNRKRAETLLEFKQWLTRNYNNISEKTKIYVLDVSKP